MKTEEKICWGLIAVTAAYFAHGVYKAYHPESGIGRVKRRIYKEVSVAQGKGVDFSQKFSDLLDSEKNSLVETAEQFGWKQTKRSVESGKSYAEAYFNSLKRAWNAVSGIEGVGATNYNVRNADGKIVLTWREIEPALDHIDSETLDEKEEKLRKLRNKLHLDPASMLPKQAESQEWTVSSAKWNDQILTWYKKNYPLDEEGAAWIRPKVTFKMLYDGMQGGISPYTILGFNVDSVIRERCYTELANLAKVSYKEIFNLGLDTKDIPAERLVDKSAADWKAINERLAQYGIPPYDYKKIMSASQTTQQQILDMWPWLRTQDAPSDTWETNENGVQVPPVTDKFNYVIWRQMHSPDGTVQAEGPLAAYISKEKAGLNKPKNDPKKDVYEDGRVYPAAYSTYTTKSVKSIKLDKIAGVGYVDDLEEVPAALTTQQLYAEFKKYGLYPDINQYDGQTEIYIDWGDWKHDHLAADEIMEKLGYVKVSEEETEENGSDTYSSVHYYWHV